MSDTTAETPHYLVERDGHILTVTLNRPEAKNAFSPSMLVGVAVATGAGPGARLTVQAEPSQ